MTSNDKQIDLLVRRYARSTTTPAATSHLDADELSAFAEGALPAATRARYISHLADCDDCRKQASAVVISGGAVVHAEQNVSDAKQPRTFWQAFAGLFALPVLRYAAFGAVVLIVAGIAFVAWRRPTQERVAELVAQNERANQQPGSAVNPPVGSAGNAGSNPQTKTVVPSAGTPLPDASTSSGLKRAEPAPGEATAAAPAPMKDAAPPPAPVTVEKKAGGQSEVAQAAPSYAPLPPGDSASQKQQQVYQTQTNVGSVSGPRQQQKLDSMDKVAEQQRDREAAKETGRADDGARKSGMLANQPQTAARRGADEKAKGPMRNMENSARRNENAAGAAEPPKTVNKAESDTRANTEESATRSAGGKKFRRQGSAWVDQKFKSSMALKNVSRGSDEFAALDSGLRSIAQQLGGEVIVVWKGKAYLIK